MDSSGVSLSKADKSELLRRVNLIRYIVPFVLFVVVASYELWEHILLKGVLEYDFHLTSEIFFFGIIGPSAVFIVLSYVARLLRQQMAAALELEVLNQSLEKMVDERTEELAEKTEILAERNTELATANVELKKLDELKSDFVSLVSHELRAPLTTINGGLELALQDVPNMSPQSRRILKVMVRESARLTRFVKTILDVSQVEAGKLSLNPGPVAVLPLLRRAVDVVFPNGDRPIVWQATADLPPLWADEIYVEEIMLNLLRNAEKHTPTNTPIEIKAVLHDDNVQISISDYGPGVPQELQSQVFERFYRLSERDRVSSRGWGLGLFLARALAEAQNGCLTVISPIRDSKDSPGANFTLTLPITAEVPDDAEIAAN